MFYDVKRLQLRPFNKTQFNFRIKNMKKKLHKTTPTYLSDILQHVAHTKKKANKNLQISKDPHWSTSSHCRVDNDLMLAHIHHYPFWAPNDLWAWVHNFRSMNINGSNKGRKKSPRGGVVVRGGPLGEGVKKKTIFGENGLRSMIHWQLDVGL